MSAARPLKYTVPSPPAETHGSEPVSAVPPVQTVKSGIVVRVHVLPPSCEDATRSLRVEIGPTSCFHVAMMFRRSAGFTAIAVSSSRPVMFVSSNRAPGQPAAKGLGPEIACRRLTCGGQALATPGSNMLSRSANPTTRNALALITRFRYPHAGDSKRQARGRLSPRRLGSAASARRTRTAGLGHARPHDRAGYVGRRPGHHADRGRLPRLSRSGRGLCRKNRRPPAS